MEPLGSDYLDRPRRSIDEATIDRVLGYRNPHSGVLSVFLRGLAVPMVIVRVGESSEDQQIVYINEAVTELLGYSLRDVIYRPPLAFCADTECTDEARIAAYRRFVAELDRNGRGAGRFCGRRRDGRPVTIEVIAGLIRLESAKERFFAAFGWIVEAPADAAMSSGDDPSPPPGA